MNTHTFRILYKLNLLLGNSICTTKLQYYRFARDLGHRMCVSSLVVKAVWS